MKRCAAAAAAAAGRRAVAAGAFATTATVRTPASASASSPQQRRHFGVTRGLFEQDHYGVLGLPKSASQEQVKKAYLSLAKKHHPDAAGGKGNSDQFNKVNEAYKTLNDPQKRQVYDMSQQGAHGSSFSGATGAPGAGAGFDTRQQGFTGWDNMDFAYTGAQGGQQTDRMGTDLGKMWEDIFGSGAGGAAGAGAKARVSRYQPKRGEDVTVKLHLGFVEAVEGTVKEVSYFYTRRCHPCKGTGSRDGAPVAKCTVCGGRGKQSKSNGYYHVEQPCAACNGAGEIVRDLCAPCGGKGSIKDRTTQQVTVPAGVNTKDRLRVAGKGEAGIRGGAAGNLYIDVAVENDSVFVRDGEDVHLIQPLSLVQAVLGGKITVPTIRGEVTVNVPSGTQQGDKLVLRGKGIKKPQLPTTGHQYVHFHVTVPKYVFPSVHWCTGALVHTHTHTHTGVSQKSRDWPWSTSGRTKPLTTSRR
eukprot:Rhum_TRINITY_DN11012_c0_g1::Rhum_TRINITY_DN11012_c0_g1_i1::g.41864::m.41864/K03686/dnaJ; molecular chaperone DnaJ